MTGRMLTGGGVLLRRVTSWLTSDGFLSGAGRVIGTLLAVLFGGGLLLAAPVLWWPLALGWLVACWCAPQQAAVEEESVDWLPALHAHLQGIAGQHLDVLAPALGLTVDDLTEWCKATELPVVKVRVGTRIRRGIRTRDLPPLPSPATTGPGVAAGQPGNGNSNAVAWIVHTPGGATEFTVEHAHQPA